MLNRTLILRSTVAMSLLVGVFACSSDDNADGTTDDAIDNSETTADNVTGADVSTMSFFLTSAGPGDGANLGGLPGADVHCANLAEAAGNTGQEWRAYLSTTGADGTNARDRIGNGPWQNANGVVVAQDVTDLLSDTNNLTKETAVTENGAIVNGRGDTPNRHDILTGTDLNGLASTDTADTTCANWTSNSTGSALVGHHDREGGGTNPMSWSTAHGTTGCSQSDLQGTGGDGLFYCFTIN